MQSPVGSQCQLPCSLSKTAGSRPAIAAIGHPLCQRQSKLGLYARLATPGATQAVSHPLGTGGQPSSHRSCSQTARREDICCLTEPPQGPTALAARAKIPYAAPHNTLRSVAKYPTERRAIPYGASQNTLRLQQTGSALSTIHYSRIKHGISQSARRRGR